MSDTPRTDALLERHRRELPHDDESICQFAKRQVHELIQHTLRFERELAAAHEREAAVCEWAGKLRRDAERYRWLRDRPSLMGWDWWVTPVPSEANITPEYMDASIDAALKADDGLPIASHPEAPAVESKGKIA